MSEPQTDRAWADVPDWVKTESLEEPPALPRGTSCEDCGVWIGHGWAHECVKQPDGTYSTCLYRPEEKGFRGPAIEGGR
jgi:hypothetical protein